MGSRQKRRSLGRRGRSPSSPAASAFETATEALGVLLWPGNYTQAEAAQAETALGEVPTYPGLFWIEEGATTVTRDPSPRGVIDWIRFRAELCPPESPAR